MEIYDCFTDALLPTLLFLRSKPYFRSAFFHHFLHWNIHTLGGLFLHILHNNIAMQHLTIRKFIFWLLTSQFSCSVVSNSLRPHGLQHARLPCLSQTPRAYWNSCTLSRWCHPTISSSVIPFSSCLQSFPAAGSLQMTQFFASGGQSNEVPASASVLPMNTQDWFPLGWTGCISLQSRVLSGVFSNTTVQKHQFFSAQVSL